MTEYDPHHDEHDDLSQPVDVPEHHAEDDRFDPPAMPPLDDLGPADATPPEELHFPGDDGGLDDPAAGLDPSAPWPDDEHFAQWLAAPDPAGDADDPAADAQLREQFAAPSEQLPSSDDLVDWTLRRLEDGS